MPAAERRRALYGLLGDLPARDGELSWQRDFVRQEEGVLIEHVTLFCNGRGCCGFFCFHALWKLWQEPIGALCISSYKNT